MPPEGVHWKPHKDILTFEEIIHIVKIMADLGIKKVRVTGGEPLLRRGTTLFLKNLRTISGIEKVALTTNGLLLGAYLDEIKNTGENILPDSINISLNALSNERYRQITRCENAKPENIVAVTEKIISIIDQLLEFQLQNKNFHPEKQTLIKINCVPIRTINDEEIIPIAALAKDRNIIVRFIELMPIGSAALYQYVSGAKIISQIEKTFGSLEPVDGIQGNGPAKYYSLPGFTGKIGFINAVTHGFCETCNRLRLTSEGFLKLCLSNNTGLSLRKLILSGTSDEKISQEIIEAVANKPRYHSLSKRYCAPEMHPNGMSGIGG